jgi:hypothetical protein
MSSCSLTRKTKMLLRLTACFGLMGACTSSTSNPPPNANGGAAGTGGATGSGGVAQASSTATGGINSSGGVSGTGGAHATGGANAAGGGITASGSGGSTSVISLPPACPTHTLVGSL